MYVCIVFAHVYFICLYARVCARVCSCVYCMYIYKNYICKTLCDIKLPNTKFIALNLN